MTVIPTQPLRRECELDTSIPLSGSRAYKPVCGTNWAKPAPTESIGRTLFVCHEALRQAPRTWAGCCPSDDDEASRLELDVAICHHSAATDVVRRRVALVCNGKQRRWIWKEYSVGEILITSEMHERVVCNFSGNLLDEAPFFLFGSWPQDFFFFSLFELAE